MTNYEFQIRMDSIGKKKDPYKWHFAAVQFLLIVAAVITIGKAALPWLTKENAPSFAAFVVENMRDEVESQNENLALLFEELGKPVGQ